MSGLAATIAGLDSVTIYGRVIAVRGLLVEIAGPIGAMSLGGRIGIEIAP
ncbi:MAG: flagellum-specific ATP synthase FliI, partial [Hyphomicrobiales bacterium]